MSGTHYLAERPLKNQAYTLYFCLTDTETNFDTNWSISSSAISKDAGTFVTTSNSFTLIDRGSTGNGGVASFTLVLTSTEMNADVIIIGIVGLNGAPHLRIIINTITAELSSVPTLNSSLTDKITAIFQYLFFKRTVTATQEKLYQSNASTLLATGTLSDDGTTFSKGAPS